MDKYKEGISGVHQNIREILKRRRSAPKAWHIQAVYLRIYGKRYSESSITARLREMADVTCNLTDYTYSIKD